jgi:hypothetical protein
MAYFDNFGIVSYRFGDNESPVLFNNLTAYVDVIDQVKENVAFYNKYTISAGERPDTLSYKLYGTPDYYWTFYLMNNHIRESGWPVDNYDMLNIAKSKYPYRVVTTNTNLTGIFPVGQSVTGVSSTTTGTVIRRISDMGQLIIDTGEEPNTTKFNSTELIRYTDVDGNIQSLTAIAESEQYNAIHHYEDVNGVHQDLTIYDFGSPSASWTPVTYRDRLEQRNDELKEIIVLKPDVVNQVAGEFAKFHRES